MLRVSLYISSSWL
uniref:Uncharacterized protein n=1 Tax=Lepeophtheirus salmonis TaxID=72036 RepID=A0A0K2TX00_LEPSM